MERDFVYVHTPIISGQDCEGAGEMFQVTTLDLEELSQGKKLDYREDFFERETSLTVKMCIRDSHVIFQCPNKDGKGVLVSPTVHGLSLIHI